MMRREDRIGQIKKGFMADMVVLTENPLVDITVLDSKEKLLAVIKGAYIAFSSVKELPVTINRNPW